MAGAFQPRWTTAAPQSDAPTHSHPHPPSPILPPQANADSWPRDLRLPAARERELYVACAAVLQACTRKPKTAAKEAYRLLLKCLSTYEVRDEALEEGGWVLLEVGA